MFTLNFESRFDQPNFEIYATWRTTSCVRKEEEEGLLLKAANGQNYSEDIEAVIQFYNTDIEKHNLAGLIDHAVA